MSDFDLIARQHMGENYLKKLPNCPACGNSTRMIGFIPPRTYQVYCHNENCRKFMQTQKLQPQPRLTTETE